VRTTHRASRCFFAIFVRFAVFATNYQLSIIWFSAEILGYRQFGERKNSESARCYVAVSPLFSLCKASDFFV
jgi:hypothetical protein